jgi:hypothetical protein
MRSDTSSEESCRDAASSGPRGANRWIALAVLSLAQLMIVLDGTIVNIALPVAQRDLGFSTDDRQWVVTGYALALGSLLLLGGRLSDLFGRKRLFLIGVGGFAVASAAGGAAGGSRCCSPRASPRGRSRRCSRRRRCRWCPSRSPAMRTNADARSGSSGR